MLRDAIIINLKLININLPVQWSNPEYYYMLQEGCMVIWPVAGVMVVTQYHSTDPPIVLSNNIWLSPAFTQVTFLQNI